MLTGYFVQGVIEIMSDVFKVLEKIRNLWKDDSVYLKNNLLGSLTVTMDQDYDVFARMYFKTREQNRNVFNYIKNNNIVYSYVEHSRSSDSLEGFEDYICVKLDKVNAGRLARAFCKGSTI